MATEEEIAGGYTDDDMSLAGLSAEERAAIRGEDDGGDETADDETAAKAGDDEAKGDDQAGDDDAGDKEGEDADDDATGEDAGGDDDEKADDEKADDEKADDEAGDDKREKATERDPFVPKFKLDPLAEDFAEKHEQALSELDQKFEEGELSATEYRKALAEINNPVLIEQAKRAALQEVAQQSAEQLWERQQDEFFELYPDYRESKIKFAGLSAALQDLYADEASANKSGAVLLREAKEAVDKELGIAKAADNDDQPARPKKPDLPQSLANLPKADNEGGGDKYSSMDNLEGLELEKAVARMSEAEAEAFGRT